MAAPFSVTPISGVDLNTITQDAEVGPGGSEDAPQLGTQVFGSDGRLYVYTEAGGVIPASTASCTVNATTFVGSTGGGSYVSAPADMALGDHGWFSKASV
jgi:hypothetical protein